MEFPTESERDQLLMRARDGNVAAIAQLVLSFERELRDSVRRIVARSKPSWISESDFVQSVLGRVVELGREEPLPGKDAREFAAWLRRVATNHVIDRLRRQRTQRRGSGKVRSLDEGSRGLEHGDGYAPIQRAAQDCPSESLANEEDEARRVKIVVEVLGSFKERDQEILLEVFEQKSIAEIMRARGFEASDDTLYERWKRRIYNLKERLSRRVMAAEKRAQTLPPLDSQAP